MDWNRAIELIEDGDAKMLAITTILLEHNGLLYMSFDGVEWEEIESKLARKAIIG